MYLLFIFVNLHNPEKCLPAVCSSALVNSAPVISHTTELLHLTTIKTNEIRLIYIIIYSRLLIFPKCRVPDPYSFDTDPDPAF
jgi:hypothetical protein